MNRGDSTLYTTIRRPYRKIYRAYACIYFAAILGLIYYRIVYMPSEGFVPWILAFSSELGFAFIWVLDQAFRWQPVNRYAFPEKLSERFEKDLPPVDIFICTADPVKEPPISVVNTVLSTLAFDYPVEKLSCYVSDDAGSILTFYALFEASRFAKIWVPFCHKYSIQQRCPEEYFSENCAEGTANFSFRKDWENVKKLYEDMEYCINGTVERGAVPEDKLKEHNGFKEWFVGSNSRDHPSIVQILLMNKEEMKVDRQGLPNLVYLAREKRPGYPHHFKAGALNALIRVSAVISNAPFILTLDCDMYANNCQALREMLCFFMDPHTGHQFGYVQVPQRFKGVTKNDLYANKLTRITQIPCQGLDGIEGPLYVGTGCIHRRTALCPVNEQHNHWKNSDNIIEDAKELSKCTYEQNTLWGIKTGMMYDCAVEDVATGFAIQCRGWKSALCIPTRDTFVGCPTINLNDTLIQQKRWTAGLLEIFVSKFCPLLHSNNIAHIMGYTSYCLWGPSSLHILCYGSLPALCMLSGKSIFPSIRDSWILLFVFLSVCAYSYSAIEFIYVGGGSLKRWWNEQRMWMIKGVSSYLFGLIQVLCKLMGISKVGFEVTSKVSDSEAEKRYEAEIFEFGVASTLFIPPSTLAMINLIALIGGIVQSTMAGYEVTESMFVQLMLSGFLVINSFPILEGMWVRKDKGRMPTSITICSCALAVCAWWIVSIMV
ncbi:cellulose synthase-like protein E6 isoform X1 [Cryptomeria japonica]|uniref:cellulose synthase-like protein E6 isoform X1 n=1 Tax=Cryptomeria japonica TaxID=3369 RepID=UPI0027DA0A7E|nr:cellulose synthase-like protein E6 isoform X1 [Cryptomeria japonica]